MIKLTTTFLFFLSLSTGCTKPVQFFSADNINIQYTGRIDFSNPKLPRFWTAGVYIQAKFQGTSCEIVVNDEMLWGTSHNYLAVIIDGKEPVKVKLSAKANTINVGEGLTAGEHTITICKNTEALIGYIEFVGIKCEKLLPSTPKPVRKIEFFGNSITSGMGSDLTSVPCDKAQWFDQHNAWLAYGPITARALNAQWHLTSESGIGLIHNCCDKPFLMPQVYDNVSLSNDSIAWDFKSYQPDVVTICLGQNDGVQDSVKFCSAYVDFLKTLRGHYPNAPLVCLTSPMADETLKTAMKKYLTGIVSHVNHRGDSNVHTYFFSRSFNSGCGGHPDLNEHQLIANELTKYMKELMKW